ncbi:MAG: flagellar export chaperone FliS [Pseudomonadales bacterium]|nr:flagellar export chaperone FliS [Pseudomonadales bacterium]
MNTMSALKAYQSVGVESKIAGANPHQLVGMLLSGLLDRFAKAKGAIGRGDVAAKGKLIGEAISIVDSLRASIDSERGGDIALNLIALYDFIERELLAANVHSDITRLDVVSKIVGEISEGWEAMPESAKDAH